MDEEKGNSREQSDPVSFDEFMQMLLAWLEENIQSLEGLSYEFINGLSEAAVSQNFGAGRVMDPVQELPEISGEMQPFTDIVEVGDYLYFTSDLKLDKEMVSYEVTESRVRVDISMEDRMQTLYVGLPFRVDPDLIEASFTNGVLDLIMKKRL